MCLMGDRGAMRGFDDVDSGGGGSGGVEGRR